MGRLTLNVLLSFAQFEREVTGERIRDKIAASKRKGMWMGGLVPLGDEGRERQLVVVESEAVTVRHIFNDTASWAACACSSRSLTAMVSAPNYAYPVMAPALARNP
jgi:DNA invertase Pin-like site-specific DNA recombinase